MKSVIVFNESGYIELDYENGREYIDNAHAIVIDDDEQSYIIKENIPIRVSSSNQSDITVFNTDSDITIIGDRVIINNGAIYYNFKRITADSTITLLDGDVFVIGEIKIYWNISSIFVVGSSYSSKLQKKVNINHITQTFPVYTRTARIIKRVPDEVVEVCNPPAVSHGNKGSLLKLIIPPLLTVGATITIGVVLGRGIYMYVMALSSVATTVFSITNYFSDKKDIAEKEQRRKEKYKEYLLKQRKILHSLSRRQQDSLCYQNLSSVDIAREIENNSTRLYERNNTDADFLTFSIGTSRVDSSYTIKYSSDALGEFDDPLVAEMQQLCEKYSYIDNMPIVLDLKKAHVGIIGETRFTHSVIKNIVAQLCFFHSYHDVEIIAIFEKTDRDVYEWMRWYPHFKIHSINMYGLVDNESVRDQILGHLTQVLKARKEIVDSSNKRTLFSPHYIFIIDNSKLIINHSIMEYLQQKSFELGFSIIFLTNIESNVPEYIASTVVLTDNQKGIIRLYESELINKEIEQYEDDTVVYSHIARCTAPFVHHKGIVSKIPESITFFDMYGVKSPEELDISNRWSSNTSYKSLSVPIGMRSDTDYLFLDLHEKAHGPHGLIAGTTGSGKSELVQSYILSLAVNYSPYEVGFLLIDYKGGGMANLFSGLPHLLGTITNLDGSEGMRALASIKAELSRRQRIFNDNNINNINQYTKMFRADEVNEPLPHLFIISDEFAELKKEQPEFMSELVSAARIGRSLGVHLILATQKPSGVVDDQIWSNSRFKIALKVQNEGDSKDVLKTPDAAHIIETGRAYLQVGNNEIYELFQSAWSGAPYRSEEKTRTYDPRIYEINNVGQGDLLNDDLSDDSSINDTRLTQLDVLVSYLNQIYLTLDMKEVVRPWLPPLSNSIVNPRIHQDLDVGLINEYQPCAHIGIVDIPDEQAQVEYYHDFIKDGNLAIYSSSGFGKSTVLVNIALDLACSNSPQLLNFYFLDFGNSALVPLKNLPHTADYISLEDDEKRIKLIPIINEEIRRRKRLFAKMGAMNFNVYNQITDKKLPMIILMIDNYEAVKEIGLEYEGAISAISRDGQGLGIYLIITATRSGSVRYSVMNNFKHRIVMYMYDSGDAVTIIGRTKYNLPEVAGRALVKSDDINIMQCFLPTQLSDDVSYLSSIRQIVDEINQKNSAPKPKRIPVLPETVTLDVLEPATNNYIVPIGLNSESVDTEYIDTTSKIMVIGGAQTGKTSVVKAIISQIKDKEALFIFDSKKADLDDFRNSGYYYSTENSIDSVIADLSEQITNRKQLYTDHGKGVRPNDFYKSLPRLLFVIEDTDGFIAFCKGREREILKYLMAGIDIGMGIIYTTVPGKLRGYDELSRFLHEADAGVVLGKPSDQTLFSVRADRNYQPQLGMGFVVNKGKDTKLKLLFI